MKKSFCNLFTNLFVFIFISVTAAGLLDYGWEISTKTFMSNNITIFISIIILFFLYKLSGEKIFKEVEANTVYLTADLFPKKLPGGQTKLNVYFPTLAILKFWEKFKEIINTEIAYSGTFEITVSAKEEDVKVITEMDWKPDTLSENGISIFAGNGKDGKSREKNIKLSVTASLRRHIENYMSGKDPDDLIENRNGIIDDLRKSDDLFEIIAALEETHGIRLSVKIDIIDHSDAMSKARDNKGTTKKFIEAAKELVKASDGTMSLEEAYRRIQLEAVPDVKETRIDLNVPKDFKGTIQVVGASH